MEDEVDWLTGQCIEWRSETCEVAVAKRVRSRSTDRRLPIRRPRVRGTEGERKVGGCELFRRDEQRQRHVRDCITSGLTMRWIGPRRCRNEEAACGIEKSGERAIGESQRAEGGCPAQQVAARSARFCALMLDGVEYQEEPLINGFCGDFYRAQNDLGSSPERQRESASLRSPAVRLGWPRIRFQTITSEYHRGERAGGAAGGKHRGEVGLVRRCQPAQAAQRVRPLLRRRSNAMGSQPSSDMICATTKKPDRRCCESVASGWRSIPVQHGVWRGTCSCTQ